MNRRNFITGVFGGVTAAGLIIKSPDMAFGAPMPEPESPLIIAPPAFANADAGQMVFDSNGNPLGIIQSVHYNREMHDVTHAGDQWTNYHGGLHTVEMRVIAYGQVQLAKFTRLDKM